MRGILLSVLIFGMLPIILFRPDFGILVWAWLGFMNPHRLTWGAAYSFPFAQIVAITILLGMLLSDRWRFPPLTRETVLLATFVVWFQVTTLFAINQASAWLQWEKVLKIQAMVFVTMMVIRSQKQLRALVWVIVTSLAFYGVKGGVWTVLSGGENRVYGPAGSFIEGNNEIGLALLMAIPLMWYLQTSTRNRWVKISLVVTMVLCAIAVLGTHSRGAALGIVAMVLFLVAKSKRRLSLALLVVIVVPISLSIMPQKWFDRMDTMRNYEQDSSATGRLNAWQFAFNLALARPIVGGGFETFVPELFSIYAPEPSRSADAHSIYFEVLGEHGFVGLALFLGLGISLWRACSWTIRRARDDPDLEEFEHLQRMVQVSLVAYAVSGAFLGLAYFDLFYNLIAIAVIAKISVVDHMRSVGESERAAAGNGGLRRRLALPGPERVS